MIRSELHETSEDRTIPRADYESTPISRSEYIAAIVHLYRGELYRANSWRIRLDNTTNWAILATAGVMTYSFGDAGHSHWVLLLGMALVMVFLFFEGRRFRFYYVWRARVRMIEENFYGPILRRDPTSPDEDWGKLVAGDLFRPRFRIGRFSALRARLVRNYWAIFLVVFVAWCIKIAIHPTPAESIDAIISNMGDGFLLPWWTPLAYVGGLMGVLIGILFAPKAPPIEGENWDKIATDASSIDI